MTTIQSRTKVFFYLLSFIALLTAVFFLIQNILKELSMGLVLLVLLINIFLMYKELKEEETGKTEEIEDNLENE
ncbi:MAG: hypothetical protein JW931_08905 [Methanomicrobiaceae archaeon]|nr:hypothetical protein [Methanomicrobiaceae archaeon]